MSELNTSKLNASKLSRRNLLKACVASTAAVPLASMAMTKNITIPSCSTDFVWGKGIENQRKPDLGNGQYLNPIVPGDHPDPTILKDGDDYYMTFSSFNSYPGIVIWHSKDLVNWTPIGPALHKNIGTVWALDICKHEDRYYVYIPAAPAGKPWSIFVIWTDDINGKWSDPIDLNIEGCIDPGHMVGEDGKRYLFVNGIRKIKLTDDGLATDGKIEHAYAPWRFPEHWITENFAPEGPKLLKRNDWFYIVTAVGGTAGPVTGHMVIAARSRSIHGPWQHCPSNPLVRTESIDEPWWSRGHATLVEGPTGDWWMVYHGYENGYRTLGRQTLLEPIEWTDDGWFKAKGGDLSQPMPVPFKAALTKGSLAKRSQQSGFALSDDFSTNKFGMQWAFHTPRPEEMSRVKYLNNGLQLKGAGDSPANSSPITCGPVDRAYQAEVTLTLQGDAEAGLILFYNHKAFVGLGINKTDIKTFQYAEEHPWARVKADNKTVRLRLINDEHVLTFEYSHDNGKTWRTHQTRMEVSGINHNVFGGFLSLKIGIYCVGQGTAQLSDFQYKAI